MTTEEIKLRRLDGQHILAPTDTHTVVKDLCGVQAQFLTHALHGLSIRCPQVKTDGLVKSWTNRGTMHLFSADDLPLFLHEGRTHFLRAVDTLDSDAYIGAGRKAFFAELIVDAIARGIDERDALKDLCIKAGMTDSEGQSVFDPWGGTIRALCEAGRICHRVQEKKAYQLCPSFEPMEREPAQIELARRYFTHFGPATVKDAAYFFGTTQSDIKARMQHLPLLEAVSEGRTFFRIDREIPSAELPRCLFLAGFDQLMLGYEKTQSLFLPAQQLREIFTRAGIVRPALLVNGTVTGWWNLKNRRLKVVLFACADEALISDSALRLWPDLRQIEFCR